MNYEDFLYELIRLLADWGTWNGSIEIFYDGKKYKACENKSEFRDLANVSVNNIDESDEFFINNWPDKCEMAINLNGALVNLFEYGVLVVDVSDLPFEKKEEVYNNSYGSTNDYMEEFEAMYNEEDIRENPEEFGLPSSLEFDSADEYELFLDAAIQELINEEEKKFIADMFGKVTLCNDLEAEICDLCIKYYLSYRFVDASLYIGQDLS